VPTRPTLFCVCGLPGAGKTTLARQLAGSTTAVRLSGDEWLADLGIDLFDEATRDRLEVLFWRLAQDLLRLGQSVILESGFWLRSDRDEKRVGAHALGARVELVYLDVGVAERWRRIERRNAAGAPTEVRITREQLEGWDQFFEPPDRDEIALFDDADPVELGVQTPSVLEVRAATADDADGCVAVAEALPEYFTTGTHEEIRQAVTADRSWVAIESGNVVGFVVTQQHFRGTAEITFAAVTPDRRHAGLGTTMVTHALDVLAADGVAIVEVKTLDATAGYEPYVATHAFWENLGFRQVDRIDPLPGWEPGNPAAILVRALRKEST
jgi:predicted kinase/N-acetylglutamate synthase-like GNAT family acetyltransferase